MNILLERINEVCKTVRAKNDCPVTFKKLLTQLRKTFKDRNFDLIIKSKKDKFLDQDKFYIMAYYDSVSDEDGETPIEVIVHHNFLPDSEFGRQQITEFLIEIFDAVAHEYRHQYQSVRRNYKSVVGNAGGPYEVYLTDRDEIDAYAFSITLELLRIMDVGRAKRNLSRISIMSKMRTGMVYSSPTLRAYISHFGVNLITRKLAKKIYLHLDTVDKRHVFM